MKAATALLFFNKPAMTRRCLASVRAGNPRGPVILVDNGSEAGARAEIEAAVSTSPIAGRETVLTLKPNAGFARGMNAGLRGAFAKPDVDWVLLLSNDIELPESFYSELEREIETAPSTAILCPRVHHLIDRSKPSYSHGCVDVASGALSHHFDPDLVEIRFPHYYPAAATVWSRVAFERLGGFNEDYFCYWEDVDLSLRCARAGIVLRAARRLVAHHLGRGTTKGKRSYSAHFARGREIFLGGLATGGSVPVISGLRGTKSD